MYIYQPVTVIHAHETVAFVNIKTSRRDARLVIIIFHFVPILFCLDIFICFVIREA